MAKVAIIGAGSIIFSTTLLNDMLATECLQDATFALMDPEKWKLEKIEAWAKGVIKRNKFAGPRASLREISSLPRSLPQQIGV
jgi:alpha-galactosidase/6-phospho-beta-glucosidase family protein